MVINKFPNREVYEKIKAKGSLGANDVNVLEDYPGPELPDSTAEDAGKLLQVGADGAAAWGSKLPTALKNPQALTFTGAATGTYDGSEALTINIPAGGSGSSGSSSGGALKAMSAVGGYIGIPAAELPENGVVWMCIADGETNQEYYSGTITMQGGALSNNNMVSISSNGVIQVNQVAQVSDGIAIYGMSASAYTGVYQVAGAGGDSGENLSLGMTSADIADMQDAAARAEAEEKHRPLTIGEVAEMLVRQQINTLAVDDQTALRMIAFYPEYEVDHEYKPGEKFVSASKLYKVLQAHTSQSTWVPGAAGTESLYARIDEEHDGTQYDPIPYEGNMELYAGKYYTQGGVLYRCTRDTGNPVYNALSELVGLYVEMVSND